MRKIRKFSFFGFLGVLTVVLFLAGISLMQAQVQTQGKPEKPPGKPEPDKPGEEEAIWAVRIPTSGYMFYGMNSINGNPYYLHNGDNIEVSVEKNKMTGYYGRYNDFVYALNFFLTNKDTDTPPKYYVGFQSAPDLMKIPITDTEDLGKPCCQFPPEPCEDSVSDSCYTPCMADFLNNEHPYSNENNSDQNYEFFWIQVRIFDFDIEDMLEGNTYKFLIRNTEEDPPLDDSFEMQTQYRKGCQRDPAFHNVEIYNHESYDYEIRITKLADNFYNDITCEGIWRIEVNGPLHVREMYCSKDKGRSTFYTPLKATGNFNFYVDWIKNPVKK